MSLDQFFKKMDARYTIPRPASSMHLDSYQASLRFLNDFGQGFTLFAAGLISAVIWWKIADLLSQIAIEIHHYVILGMIICILISLLEISSLVIPYYRITQRVTQGSARWADVGTLKGYGLAYDTRQILQMGALRLGRLTRNYDLALPLKQVLCHMA